MKAHTNSFKEQIKLIGKEIDSRITFGDTVLGKDDLNAVTPSYQGSILKSVMKQLDIDSNVAIPIGTILTYEFGLKVNGEYEYINYGNYVVYSIEKQEDTNSYKMVCYDKLLYSMLDYVNLPITYPISIRDYINTISTALGLTFANRSETFVNYDKQIQADLYDGLGYTFRDILDELAQVTASTICLNNNDELEIRYITETGDTIDEEFLKDVNVNFGEKFGAVNTIVLSRSADSDSVYYPSVLPTNPYEIKISDNQIMNGNDRADFLPDIYNKLNGLEFYTNDFVSTGIVYYDLCDRYSVRVGDNTYSCVMFNDEVLVTQGLEENIYTELPEQTETDYKHASKDDRMINQVYIIAKKNEAEILAVVNTTEQIQKEINPPENASGSEIIVEDASNNPLLYLEVEGKSTQETRSGKNLCLLNDGVIESNGIKSTIKDNVISITGTATTTWFSLTPVNQSLTLKAGTYTVSTNRPLTQIGVDFYDSTGWVFSLADTDTSKTFTLSSDKTITRLACSVASGEVLNIDDLSFQIEVGDVATEYEPYGVSPSPDYPSEIESVGYENLFDVSESISGAISTSGSIYPSSLTKVTDYIPITANKEYTFSFDCDNFGSTDNRAFCIYDENKNYVSGEFYDVTKRTLTETFSNNGYIRIGYDINCYDIQVVEVKEKHSYIPYGKYGIEVETVGKNLFDVSKISEKTYLESATGNTGTSSVSNVSDYIRVKANKTYILNFDYESLANSSNRAYCFYDENKNFLSGGDYYPPNKQALITPTTDGYIRFGYDINSYNVQFEKGTKTTYQPYQNNTLLMILNSPLKSLPNGVKDIAYIKNNRLYVDHYVGSEVFDGSEDWWLHTGNQFRLKINGIRGGQRQLSTHFRNSFDTEIGCIVAYQDDYLRVFANFTTLDEFKSWLSTNNVQVDYELVEPYTEEIGEIETLKTLLGYNKITTTDDLQPTLNITYVRDTVLADYVENHIAELKINEEQISQRVETIDTSVDGLQTDISRVEQITTDTSQVLNIVSTNIDKTTGDVREVTTTTGFTFNKDGMEISDDSGFKGQHTAQGTFYKDGDTIVGQYTKDGSKQKDLELFGTYSYGKTDIDDTPMFVGQLYTDENGDEGFGHFYNGGDY